MQHYIDIVAAWMTAHPELTPFIWPLFTLAFTMLFHWAESSKTPLLGKLVTFFKVTGVDGPKAAVLLASLFRQQTTTGTLQAAVAAATALADPPVTSATIRVEQVLPPRDIEKELTAPAPAPPPPPAPTPQPLAAAPAPALAPPPAPPQSPPAPEQVPLAPVVTAVLPERSVTAEIR